MGLVIGIGGVSRSGKSTLSKKIADWYVDKKVSILSMDDYVFPTDQIPRVRGAVDWEVPESVDYTRLAAAIADARTSSEIVIVEGILVFNDAKILALYDRMIFIEIDYDIFLERKKQDRRWDEPDWFIEHIWTSYIVYGKQNIEGALLLSGSEKFDTEEIMRFIGTIP